MYESPKWTIGIRREQSPPSEDGLDFYDGEEFGVHA
jgi:hypothetical protein